MIWLIGLGGSLGAAVRYLLGNIIKKSGFPIVTWFINLTGSFLLGILAGLYQGDVIPDWLWLLVGVGFCGAYTTFSTFSYETLILINNGKVKTAGIYVIITIIFGLISANIGFALT